MALDVRPPDRKKRLAIVAGRGRLPLDIAQAARAAGEDPIIIALNGEASDFPVDFDQEAINLADGKRLLSIIKDNKVDRVILSGGINRRPDISELRLPLRLLKIAPKIGRALTGAGDDRLLRVVISMIETSGCRVIGAQDVVPDLLAQTGPLTTSRPDKKDWNNIATACAGANALGALDVGQGAVAVGGRIVALEGAEGTDGMLERVAQLRDGGRISVKKKGVLVKLCKPQQDERADLPSIGPDTIRNVHRAGLSGIALDAGRALILDRELVVGEANRLGLFVVGVDRDDPAGTSTGAAS
ncbi:MAG: UDP-2,3-diacylglucosamine diphosphatase LpxI [Hyphomicrobiales bacterium]|nr:UDP-2,3-diacylglucosamine diphosphatase LpxI [Hyphomicrobiales bacterium]MCP4999633.1 UDP-2,3-diacylglucosamine diphosphatase LpxI [Hyphomicrobiales bacterium]